MHPPRLSNGVQEMDPQSPSVIGTRVCWATPRDGAEPLEVKVSIVDNLTMFDYILNGRVHLWPPNVTPCKSFHLATSRVRVVKFLQHCFSVLWWNDYSSSPKYASIDYTQFQSSGLVRCKFDLQLVRWKTL